MGTSFARSDFWDGLVGQALAMIGRWYSRQPLTNQKCRLSTQKIPKDPKNRCGESLHPFEVGKCLVSFQSLVIEPVHNTNGPRIEGRVKKARLLYINFKLDASFLSSVYFSPFFYTKIFFI